MSLIIFTVIGHIADACNDTEFTFSFAVWPDSLFLFICVRNGTVMSVVRRDWTFSEHPNSPCRATLHQPGLVSYDPHGAGRDHPLEGTMKKILKNGVALSAALMMSGAAGVAQAADSVNVAFFLEWATPNQIAKVDKAYDEAMGVDVNWTDFSTGVQMTEAMLAGDIDIAYSQGLAPFVTAIQQGAPLKMVSVAVIYEANDCFVNNNSAFPRPTRLSWKAAPLLFL